MDDDNSGTIELNELRALLKKLLQQAKQAAALETQVRVER